MRIAIDARPALDPRRTGVGHYTRQMVRHLPLVDGDDRYVAWYLHARGLLRPRRFFDGVGTNLHEHPSHVPARVFQPVSWRLGVPRLEWLGVRFDALLATNFLPPPTRSEGVVLVVHDLAWAHLPRTAPQMDARWRRRFAWWLGRAAAVIVPSQSTRSDLLSLHDVDPARVHAIAHGADPVEPVAPGEVERIRERHGIGGRYALFVGGIEPRKNLDGLLEAFRRIETDAWLVVAGGRVNWIPGESGRLETVVSALPVGVRRRVRLTGYVSEGDKRALLAGAEALAYPSRYEGFGFPILEAFAAGVPVLTSNSSSLPEVAGEAAVLVDPSDPNEIATGLSRLLGDRELRDRLRELGAERVRTFTWTGSARKTAEVLAAAARR